MGEFFTTVFVPLVFGYLLVGFAIYWERGSPKYYRTLLLLLLLCVVCVACSLYTVSSVLILVPGIGDNQH